MDEQETRRILGDTIEPDGSLYCLGHYKQWNLADETVCLDCSFTAEELEAIAWWMRRKRKEKP